MAKLPMIVVNQTNNTLVVKAPPGQNNAYRGGDLSDVATGVEIGPNIGRIIAWYNTPSNGSDNWDWIYLQDLGTMAYYQIYVEWNNKPATNSTYAFFGYYNSNSSQSNGNPSPFENESDYESTSFITTGQTPSFPVYILKATPPSQS